MSRFTPEFLDELRTRTTLSTLVGRSVKLARAGREWKACCPFHHEKSPSFYVNDDKGFYHCFGCSAHGDVIRWLTDQRGLTFMDAVKELADAAGLALPAPDPRAAERESRASKQHDVMAAAAEWFAAQLREDAGAEARAYLARRGLSAATIAAFGIGFAPDRRDALKSALARFGDAELVEAGLLISVEDKAPYDRFRGRVMIPIRDPRGRVIAFGGRILGSGEPKYLNSPDTPLFDKGRTLYNLDRAAPLARKAGRLIVVEGYMDAIALAQAGIGEVVAPLGTALTEAQLERLWRVVDVPVLCFDGDSAGQKAAVRAAERALPLLAPGRSLSVALLPGGQDPDDLVRTGGVAAVEQVLSDAVPLVDLLWTHEVAATRLRTPEERAALKQRLGERVSGIGDADVRAHYREDWRGRYDAMFFQRTAAPSATWRPGRKPYAVRTAPGEKTRGLSRAASDTSLLHSIFAGLIAYPAALWDQSENLAMAAIGDPAIAALRETLLDTVSTAPAPLDPLAVVAICRDRGHAALVGKLLKDDGTPRPMYRSVVGNDASLAPARLAGAIAAVVEQGERELSLAALGAADDDAGLEYRVALVKEASPSWRAYAEGD